jgi:hypothetical protein
MVLAGSFEFDKFHNAEIIERPSDNEEVPMVRKCQYIPVLMMFMMIMIKLDTHYVCSFISKSEYFYDAQIFVVRIQGV